jgi:hypothetical protein
MNPVATLAVNFAAKLPAPPVPGGSAGDDNWWRLLGIVMVSLVTVAILLIIFRPLAPAPADCGDEQRREDDELARLAAQLTAGPGTDAASSVIPFRPRARAGDPERGDEISNAAARLRRILGQAAPDGPTNRPARRRLGEQLKDVQEAPEGDQATGEAAHAGERDVVPDNDNVSVASQSDIWGDLNEIANLIPSEADRQPVSSPTSGGKPEGELPGDQGSRHPSEADESDEASDLSGQESQLSTISGEIPTEHDLNRLGSGAREQGKIVQFVPRPGRGDAPGQGAPLAPVRQITVDAQTREAVESVIRQLLFYANVGEVLQGFGLYTDEHLRRFMSASGMPEREFQALFAAVPPKQPEDWTRIEFISRIVRLDGGQVSADVRYIDGHQPNGSERLTFVQDPATKRWLIDDIQAI